MYIYLYVYVRSYILITYMRTCKKKFKKHNISHFRFLRTTIGYNSEWYLMLRNQLWFAFKNSYVRISNKIYVGNMRHAYPICSLKVNYIIMSLLWKS